MGKPIQVDPLGKPIQVDPLGKPIQVDPLGKPIQVNPLGKVALISFDTPIRTYFTLIFIIIILPFLLYLLCLTYYHSVTYLLLTFTRIIDRGHIIKILYIIPVSCLIGLSMILAYRGII
jgi:hypothetical protein